MSPAPNNDPVEKAIESGQLWRAKEILSGRVGSSPFDADLYETFGALLLRMGDDVQAGRFLFLSGKRRSEYQPAIDLFLQKHARAGRGGLFAAFPASVRRRPWAELPMQVQQELAAIKRGIPGDNPVWAKPRFLKGESVFALRCLVVLLVLVGCGLLLAFVVVRLFY